MIAPDSAFPGDPKSACARLIRLGRIGIMAALFPGLLVFLSVLISAYFVGVDRGRYRFSCGA